MKLDKAKFRYIEHELYNYDLTKLEIEELRVDIISGTPQKDDNTTGIQTTRISNPTAARGEKLVTSKAIVQMERVIRAIDRALARLNDTHRMLFELKYRQALSWQGVVVQMAVCDRSYFGYRLDLVKMVALELGLISDLE